ncbi:hypothetical protein [Glycomyces buryatensis]|uniref:Uncharacterized protein n=1 Tax=Glycomyces buryatensis TaxID=2570927 RepID=A0A4S8QML4_9ACTN|nr:hypothetical protein [Glycomyces buryatensis]THV42669.1 hypothetical protein FAB82_05750 [Glycomyces buryatensis]
MTDYIEQWFYDITPVRRLPTPDELERPDCMVRGISGLRRAWRQRRPTGPKLCCWYHDGSWEDASQIAIGLVEEVTTAGHSGEDLIDAMRDAVRGRGLLGWTDKAVRSLLVGGEPICIGSTADWNNGERYYVGGRHRALAMMQQGVRRTVTMRLELLDSDTGDLIRD